MSVCTKYWLEQPVFTVLTRVTRSAYTLLLTFIIIKYNYVIVEMNAVGFLSV